MSNIPRIKLPHLLATTGTLKHPAILLSSGIICLCETCCSRLKIATYKACVMLGSDGLWDSMALSSHWTLVAQEIHRRSVTITLHSCGLQSTHTNQAIVRREEIIKQPPVQPTCKVALLYIDMTQPMLDILCPGSCSEVRKIYAVSLLKMSSFLDVLCRRKQEKCE